jgi:peptide/nickel transport system substrate-binding protein
MRKSFVFSLAILVFMGLGLQVSAGPTNEQLVIGIQQEFENMNPMITQMSLTQYSYSMVGRALMTLNADTQWIPMLAKKIPSLEKNGGAELITENGVKKVKATWEIWENAKWGDGKPVTGEDVKFSWTVAQNENVAIGGKEVYLHVERIEIDPANPKKFTFIYKKPKWDFYQKPNFYILPKHLEEPILQKYGNEKQGYEKNSLYSADPSNPGLYCGPYLIKELKLGSHIIFEPNPFWFGKKPNIKKIIVKLIPSTAALEANLLSGSVDMISELSLPFDQALAFEKKVKEQNLPYVVNFRPGLIYEHIDLQLSNPILQDIRVRRALVYGINRQELVDTLYSGKQEVAIHDLSPVDPWYTNNPKKIVLYEFSRAKANKLLDEAGWILDPKDGYRYKNNEKLSLQLMTTADNKPRELAEVYLQEQWKKIGVEISIKNEPARVFFGETTRKSLYPGLAMYAWLSSPDNNPRSFHHKDSIPTEANGFSGQNPPRWVNEEVSRLIDEMDTTFDAKKREEQRHKILWHYTNDVPVIPLFYRVNISVTPKNLTGYKLSGSNYHATLHVENWNLQ